MFQVISEKSLKQRFYEEFERDFYTEIIVTIIPANLVAKSLLSHFFPFRETNNKNQVFSNLVVWQQEIVSLFVYNKSRSTSKACQIQ